MEIKRVVSPLLDSNMYIVSENNHCIIIDPYSDEQVIQLGPVCRPLNLDTFPDEQCMDTWSVFH